MLGRESTIFRPIDRTRFSPTASPSTTKEAAEADMEAGAVAFTVREDSIAPALMAALPPASSLMETSSAFAQSLAPSSVDWLEHSWECGALFVIARFAD